MSKGYVGAGAGVQAPTGGAGLVEAKRVVVSGSDTHLGCGYLLVVVTTHRLLAPFKVANVPAPTSAHEL